MSHSHCGDNKNSLVSKIHSHSLMSNNHSYGLGSTYSSHSLVSNNYSYGLGSTYSSHSLVSNNYSAGAAASPVHEVCMHAPRATTKGTPSTTTLVLDACVALCRRYCSVVSLLLLLSCPLVLCC